MSAQLAMVFEQPQPIRVETPAARASDPVTSHLAAEEHTRSGKRGHQQSQAAAAVKALPGRTSFELALATDICRFVLARRLPECVTGGSVLKGAPKHCSVTGKLAVTWWPAGYGVDQ